MGHFGYTYLPMSYVFYTMPITLVQFLLRYLPTPKSDIIYERSLMLLYFGKKFVVQIGVGEIIY